MAETRKAGENNMAAYVDYLNNYNREKRGAGSEKGTDRFSALDIRHVHNAAKDFGISDRKAAKQVLQYARRNEDETLMGGKAQDALDRLRELASKKPEKDTPEPTPSPTPTPTPTPEASKPEQGGGQQTGNVSGGDSGIVSPISQNNDIGIDGNNNLVNQDNSISQTIDNRDQSDNRRYYGGSNRVFNYQGGGGESGLYDSPVSKATMGGFFDTDDSPAAAARFMDMYIDSNNLNQRGMRKEYDKYKITDYGPNNPNRISELEGKLDRSTQASRDRAKKQELVMFGENPFSGGFQLPQIPEPMKDNTKDIYEDAMDRIKKI